MLADSVAGPKFSVNTGDLADFTHVMLEDVFLVLLVPSVSLLDISLSAAALSRVDALGPPTVRFGISIIFPFVRMFFEKGAIKFKFYI